MLTPLNKNVIIKRTKKETKSLGGIVLPDSQQEQPTSGLIIAKSLDLPDIKVGDNVLFGKYAGKEMKVGTETLLVMPYEELIAKI